MSLKYCFFFSPRFVVCALHFQGFLESVVCADIGRVSNMGKFNKMNNSYCIFSMGNEFVAVLCALCLIKSTIEKRNQFPSIEWRHDKWTAYNYIIFYDKEHRSLRFLHQIQIVRRNSPYLFAFYTILFLSNDSLWFVWEIVRVWHVQYVCVRRPLEWCVALLFMDNETTRTKWHSRSKKFRNCFS